MNRILQNTAATLTVTFEVDGVPTDPSPASATVTITRADGTSAVATTAATHGTTGVFTYTVAPPVTGTLDTLTATWTATFSGVAQTLTTRAEVVGGFLFTVAQAKATTGLTSTTAEIQEARTYAEQELEDACGVAFVPRYRLDTRIRPASPLALPPMLRTVRSLTLDGTATDVTTLSFDQTGILRLPWNFGWSSTGKVVIGYEHGWDAPPVAVSRAALTLARDYLTQGPVADRAIQQATDYGPVYLATPGFKGKRFGIPAVDAVVEGYGYVVGVA